MSEKTCEVCGIVFAKPRNVRRGQWESYAHRRKHT